MDKKEDSLEKLDLRSIDIASENRNKLKSHFPGIFVETKNEKGETIESINFEKLKAEIWEFSELFEKCHERYGMDRPGKKDCMKLIQQPSVATLKPCREESVNFDGTENLFIEGDNLEVSSFCRSHNKLLIIIRCHHHCCSFRIGFKKRF